VSVDETGNNLIFQERAFHVARLRAGFRFVTHLARACGMDLGKLYRISHGHLPARHERVLIAHVLNVRLSTLWRRSPEPGRKDDKTPAPQDEAEQRLSA